jgi:hypothetical protein
MKMLLGKPMRLILFLSALISAVSLMHTPSVAGETSRWKIGKPITTYWGLEGFSIDEAYAKQMAEGGWNLAWTRSDTVSELNVTLDIAQSHGLRALWAPVSGNIRDATVISIRNHPAL